MSDQYKCPKCRWHGDPGKARTTEGWQCPKCADEFKYPEPRPHTSTTVLRSLLVTMEYLMASDPMTTAPLFATAMGITRLEYEEIKHGRAMPTDEQIYALSEYITGSPTGTMLQWHATRPPPSHLRKRGT